MTKIKREKRTLILIKNIDGGTGLFVNQLLQIKKIDPYIKFDIACLESPHFRKKFDNYTVFFYKKNVQFIDSYRFLISLIISLIKEAYWLKRLFSEQKPALIITIDSHCLIIAHIAQLFCYKKIKTIATIHNNLEAVIDYKIHKVFRYLVKKTISYMLDCVNTVVCVSYELSNHLYSYLKLKIKPQTIYYDLDKKYSDDPILKPKSLKTGADKTILTISRLYPQKDLTTIIKAFKIIQKKIPKSKLLIVGDGPMKQELIKLVKRLKLINVKFFGWLENPINILRQSDLFVFSSNWEGFGYTIIEALSQSLPIVSTNTFFGPSEILDNGAYGVLIPVGDAVKMGNEIVRILTNKKKYDYYAQKALERSKFFSEEKMLETYKRIIIDLSKK